MAVEVSATHLCEVMRGVERATETTTRAEVVTVTAADREQFREAIRRGGTDG